MSKDLRKFPRNEEQIEVELNFLEDSSRMVITRDSSSGGFFMLLNNAEHYTIGEMVTVNFKNPFDNFKVTQKDAIIVRHSDEGIAIAFIEMEEF